jgi:hypothetical protein
MTVPQVPSEGPTKRPITAPLSRTSSPSRCLHCLTGRDGTCCSLRGRAGSAPVASFFASTSDRSASDRRRGPHPNTGHRGSGRRQAVCRAGSCSGRLSAQQHKVIQVRPGQELASPHQKYGSSQRRPADRVPVRMPAREQPARGSMDTVQRKATTPSIRWHAGRAPLETRESRSEEPARSSARRFCGWLHFRID